MQNERTPLIAASSRGHTAVVELLISRGAHVNDTDVVREFCYYASVGRASEVYNSRHYMCVCVSADFSTSAKTKRCNLLCKRNTIFSYC